MEVSRSIQKRQVAYKVGVKSLLEGSYIRNEGEWEPNYVLAGDKKISRANILGVLVLKSGDDERFQTIVIDDGSEKISIRSFEETSKLNEFNIGDIVRVIGRIREFGSERYIVPEILKKIEDADWIKVRRAELGLEERNKKETEAKEEVVQTDEAVELPSEKIFKLIREMDSGNGADAEEVVSKSDGRDTEKIIAHMLEEGEIFEVKPGKLKVLE